MPAMAATHAGALFFRGPAALRTVRAISSVVTGFMTCSPMPAARAFSGGIVLRRPEPAMSQARWFSPTIPLNDAFLYCSIGNTRSTERPEDSIRFLGTRFFCSMRGASSTGERREHHEPLRCLRSRTLCVCCRARAQGWLPLFDPTQFKEDNGDGWEVHCDGCSGEDAGRGSGASMRSRKAGFREAGRRSSPAAKNTGTPVKDIAGPKGDTERSKREVEDKEHDRA